MMNLLILKAVQLALCQFFNFCLDSDECPDGVCDDALDALDKITEETPPLMVAPGKTMAFGIGDIDWGQLENVVNATVALATALKAFFGINRVG